MVRVYPVYRCRSLPNLPIIAGGGAGRCEHELLLESTFDLGSGALCFLILRWLEYGLVMPGWQILCNALDVLLDVFSRFLHEFNDLFLVAQIRLGHPSKVEYREDSLDF